MGTERPPAFCRLAAARVWLRSLAPDPSSLGERLIGAAFAASAGALWWFSDRLSGIAQALLWAGWLLTLTAAVRTGLFPLFGPVFFCDFVRGTRRSRYAVLRIVYALALFLFLLALYRNHAHLGRVLLTGPAGMARFAETFCYTFLTVQFVAVAVLTPAYTAGAIAEEKDRKTLEFLLATEVRNREIVLGKLAARLGSVLLLVLTGLPILSLTQLWGGVDFGLLLAFFAGTGLTALSLGGLSILTSAYCRRARDAIVLTYLAAVGYLALSALGHLLLLVPGTATLALTPGSSPTTLGDIIAVFNAGNPALTVYGLRQDILAGTPLQDALPVRLKGYAAVHVIIALACVAWAVCRLRVLALEDTHVRETPTAVKGRWRWRPRLARDALVWKEVWAEPGLSFNWFGKAVVALIILASFVPAVWIGGQFVWSLLKETGGNLYGTVSHTLFEKLGEAINLWVRVVGTLVGCLTLLGVAIRAASSVSGERDRQTLDSLLTTPVDSNALLYAKWVGSLFSVRRALVWLALIWLLGAATGGLYLPTVPWMLLAWFVYAAFLAVLGLWFSIRCHTTLRATVWTLLTAAGLGVGHWYLWLVFCMPLGLQDETVRWWLRFELYGLTPPLALAWFAFRSDDVSTDLFVFGRSNDNPWLILVSVWVGLALWALAAWLLWRRACRRFRVLTGRVALVAPAAEPPFPALAGSATIPASDRVPSRPAPGRRRRALLGALAGLVLLAAGSFVYFEVSAERDLRRALEETTRADPGWRLPDIEAARAMVPEERNAGSLVLAVHALIPLYWHYRDAVNFRDALEPPVRLTPDQVRGITNELEDVEEALSRAKPLADLPEGRYQIAWSRDYVATLLPHLHARQGIRQMVLCDVLLQAEEGDSDGALTAARRLLNIARSVGDEPLLISQSVRNRDVREATRVLQRVLAQGEPSEAGLAEWQALLEKEESHPGLWIGARGERAGLDIFVALIQSGEVPYDQLSYYDAYKKHTWQDTFDALRFSFTPGAEKSNRAALLRFMNRVVEAASLPVEEQTAAFEQLESAREELPWLARQLSSSFANMGVWHRQPKAEVRCAIAALAAERFRRANDRWPTGLEELVPRYLGKVPLDPADGSPLRFRRLPDGIVIYALGIDARDDGGSVDTRLNANREKSGQDVGFRLWDVDRRRQPARQMPAAAAAP